MAFAMRDGESEDHNPLTRQATEWWRVVRLLALDSGLKCYHAMQKG